MRNGVHHWKRQLGALALSTLVLLPCAPAGAKDIKLYVGKDQPTLLYKDGRSYALVIGIDNYRLQKPLNHAADDAAKVAGALIRHGFPEENVRLLKDPNLTGQQLREEVERFVWDVGFVRDARVLIWYAGHGMTVDGEGYMLGVDAPGLDRNSPTLDQDLKSFYAAAMPLRSFGVHLRQMRSRHVLLILDTCFAGTIFSNTRASTSAATSRAMARPGRQIIAAGLAGEEAADNGNFARLFVDAIEGRPSLGGVSADANRDGYLSGTELGFFMAQEGQTAKQHPRYARLRRDVDQTAADALSPPFTTDQLDLELGEFFFVLPDFVEPVATATSAIVPAAATVAAVAWEPLALGTTITGTSPAGTFVYRAEPPNQGESKVRLERGQSYPSAGTQAVFEKATIGAAQWLRFRTGAGKGYGYVKASDVAIAAPPG